MDKFITSIKKKYRDRLTYKEDRWPPRHSSKLIRLELIEKKKKVGPNCNEYQPLSLEEREDKDVITKRTPLAYHDVFKVESGKKTVRKVLVEGDAGIGKTTLCVAISEDWANGKLFQQFKLLLLLPLCHPKVSKARSLSELLKLLHSNKSVCKSVVNYLQEEEGENVLIIADGWDELDTSQQHTGSFLYEVLLTELPFASVLITSRPSASDPLRKHMDRFIDMLGFNKKSIKKFIIAEFANQQKSTGLSKQLESNPLLESVCSVPLNCVIVCHLWRTLEEALPTTMTELYRKIILNFILRNIRKTDTYHDIKLLTDFDSLPNDLKQSWWQLCEFSFQALIKSQIIFSQEDLGEFFSREVSVDESLLFFGLLQPVETILETGCGVSYHFLHLTFQEYLAALYLVKCPLDKLSDSNLLYQALSGNFTMVWRFYFGSYFHESKKYKPDIKLVRKHISGIKSFIKHDDLLLWHCALEAKSKDVVDLALDFAYNDDAIDDVFQKDYNVIDFGESSNAYDCEAILYGLSNIECCNTEIRFGNCGIREKQIETLGEILADKEKKIQIMGLDLSGNKLIDRSICNLFKQASTTLVSLESLNLSDNKAGVESIKAIMTTLKELPYNTLSEIDISQNPLGVQGIKALEDGIRGGTLVQLTGLDIEGSLMGVTCEVRASLIVAVGVHCPNMEEIDLSPVSDTDIHGVSIDAQLMSKKSDGILTELKLTGSCLSDKFVCELFLRSSTAFQSLSTLNLSGNGVGVETIQVISLILQRTPYNQLRSLDLSNNPLGVPGVKALEDAVRCNILDKLEELNLSGFLTSENSKQIAILDLIEALPVHCPNLEWVNISMNENDPDVLDKLARAILNYNGMFLTELDLTGNCLSDIFVREFFQRASTTFQHLKILNISDNTIGVETIEALSLKLHRIPSNTLETLDLSNNPLGVPGLQALEDTVCCDLLRNLQHLNLQKSLTSDADINGALLTTFMEALSKHSPMLKSLDLSQNNLSVPGASAISRGSIGDLNLNNTMLGDVGLNILVETFDKECHVHTVNLMSNNIHGRGISPLVDNIKHCCDINLSDNPLGLEGVLAIGRFISDSYQLNRLVLCNCQLTLSEDNVMYGKTIKVELCQMSPNSTVTRVELQCNDFSEERVHILAGIIYLCPNLEHLNSDHCQINSNDFKLLLQQFIELKASSPEVCSKLVRWHLSDNKIDDDGVSMLIDHLASLFSHLGCYIMLHNNPVSSPMLIRLREERLKIQGREVSSMLCIIAH
jgi:Ran GTPase-activating protein (RanGAP) involved in mRNA processing and transport